MTIRTVITYTLIGLAAIGLFSMLFYSPGALLRQILIFAITAVVIYGIYRLIVRNRNGGGRAEDKAFARAAKESKRRMKMKQPSSPSSASPKKQASSKRRPFRKKSANHLKVIEGKKGKRNNRVSS
ncbi:SA1362 family protein [Bacillus thermotolerans]|uniref:YqhP n=1 Tax=Bacillus thermotolerans TaxID=1221996 RepID=A0A0F5IBP7_BACTR|nr:SA1362 family protein [Bacillus thermotolerans]KKB37261.1 hypothetical protein QY97_00426 [Bacillus thermotolerans]KKB42941.1 hypothetical protein QY95_03048 [Bacillus thermotolerans]KKB43849.1 hypothetical protein QY96_00444 [Bacillus thermotolerans]